MLDLKIKFKNKNNPNYIKLVGMAKIKLSTMPLQKSASCWYPLYTLKKKQNKHKSENEEDMSDAPVGKIHMDTVFHCGGKN